MLDNFVLIVCNCVVNIQGKCDESVMIKTLFLFVYVDIFKVFIVSFYYECYIPTLCIISLQYLGLSPTLLLYIRYILGLVPTLA